MMNALGQNVIYRMSWDQRKQKPLGDGGDFIQEGMSPSVSKDHWTLLKEGGP